LSIQTVKAQNCSTIGDFTSVNPNTRGETLQIPTSHTFQKIIQNFDSFPGGTFAINVDFTGYVPINGSNTNGYLSINNEKQPGGVTVLDINYNDNTKLWSVIGGENLDFTAVGGTSRNCSGAVTPWGTVISSEEIRDRSSSSTAYKPYGWQVEIDPANKAVIAKHYAMGNFAHENAAILQHSSKTVAYQGADQSEGYLFKFVTTQQNDLSDGDLYVYKGPKTIGVGSWIKIDNETIEDRNKTIDYAINVDATVFGKIEDVEIGTDGFVYFAVKNEGRVYYLEDNNPAGNGPISFKGTYVGNQSYTINLGNGSTVVEPWGYGNDNLAFDNEGNLWVLQDGGKGHIWLVKAGHTQANPKVEVFATTPFGCEPTGITFSPDNRFMYISMQHPSIDNAQTLIDAAGNDVRFHLNLSLVIARKGNLGNYDVCDDGNTETINDNYDENCNCIGEPLCPNEIVINANAMGNTQLQSLYQSSQSIQTQVVSATGLNVIVRSNETVNLKSGHIKLDNGFKVESGASLKAEIDPCQ